MKKNIIIKFFMLICLVQSMQINAQAKANNAVKSTEVVAQVIDSKGNPIEDVLVTGNDGLVQTRTNNLGYFDISVKPNAHLVFEAEGYEKVTTSLAKITSNFLKVVLLPAKDLRVNADIRMPFQTINRKRTTGNIYVIDAEKALDVDSRLEVSAHINSKITGSSGGRNFHGLGNAITVVDGIVRDITDVNMQEIVQITVLKDAFSRMLYGADGDVPVVLLTTKSGTKYKNTINVNVEHGVATAIMKPKFLDAASYMETYNKAFRNDGALQDRFRQGVIDSTRQNLDPVLFPNNDYWSSQYVNDMTNFSNLYAEASGGNDKVQYFLNLGWKRNKGWLALPEDDDKNKFSIRGKVDFEVTSWLKMKTDIVAIFDMYKGPQSTTFFSDASRMLPHLYPVLIPRDRVLNDSALAGKNPIGNSLLGGSSVYRQNLYGDMQRGGVRSDLDRFVQYLVGFDIDLKKLTKGLSLSGMANIDFYNYYSQVLNNSYAVYQIGKPNADGNFNLTKIGEDRLTNQQTLSDSKSAFGRYYNGYLTANYDRTFGKHQVSAVALGYYRQEVISDVVQDLKRLRFGLQANYTYDEKYVLEAGLLREGSTKMARNNRFETTPSIGLAWIASNEGFLSENAIVDYLKLRANYGVLVNDNWTLGNYNGYFLYEPSFTKSGYVSYNNGLNGNSSITIQSVGNVYSYQKRKEFVAGFDTYLFKNKLWIESSYWNSLSDGNLTSLITSTPSVIGVTPVGNFNATRYQGVEFGVNYKEAFGDFKINVGVNYMISTSEIEKNAEPLYADNKKHLSRVGTSASSMWGLTSLGFYSADDFEADGTTLKSTLPKPSWGAVRPGDIKYQDIDGDGVINADDNTVLGLWGNNQHASINFDISYKNWQLFVMGSGSWGGSGMKSSAYYQFRGNEAKYSVEALKSYDPENPNPNAEYPRLSLTNGNNNYQTSSFWKYESANFWLSNVQLAYNFDLLPSAKLKTLKLYAKGGNLFTLSKNTQITQLNWNSAPQSRVFTLGLIANF
jgi:TonB-linked SusC/RagA family outer membrane protein